MKLNWKTFKVLFAFVIVIATVFWAVDEVLPHSYSGANLTFGVGSGPVKMTNPSEESVLVQMVSTGYSSFNVSSTIEGVSGPSIRQGTGSSRTQLFEFSLPPGKSEFTVSRGKDVNFVASTSTRLQATVNPVSSDTRSTTIIVAGVVILGALFYASRTTGHSWMTILRLKDASTQDTQPTIAIIGGGQGQAPRSYGDNRVEI